jgi:hypothetical protein
MKYRFPLCRIVTHGTHRSFGRDCITKLNFSTTYHPQTDRQFEWTIQTLEDMLRLCVLDFKWSWIRYLPQFLSLTHPLRKSSPTALSSLNFSLTEKAFSSSKPLRTRNPKKKRLFLSLYITKHLILDFKLAFFTLILRGIIKTRLSSLYLQGFSFTENGSLPPVVKENPYRRVHIIQSRKGWSHFEKY